MKKTYKKYGIGGIAQSTSSPMISQGMQTSLSGWGGSPIPVFEEGGKMTRGGYTKRYKSEDMYRIREKKTHERMATEGVGNFELPKDRSTRYLYALDEFDQNLVKDIKLKPNEHIFRYESEATKAGKFNPLVKINLDNQLVYFLTESGYEMDEIEFERKGEKAKFINISDKYANGGVFEVGDWVAEKKGTARGQVYKKLGSFIYLKDKYGHESQTLYSEDKFKKSVKPRYAQGGKIRNQYEGKSASEVWNMLTKEQRQHFLYDHADQIEAYRGEEKGELSSKEIIKAYNSDWADLDKDIKNRFDNHVREGEYGDGGKIEEWKKFVLSNKSWFDDESEEVSDDEVLLTTRRHGNVGREQWGKEDVDEAKQIVKKVTSQFPNVSYEIEQVDEFVYLYFRPSKMADGGFVGDVAGSDLTPTMMGGGMGSAQDAILKNGGQAQVQIENKDLRFNKNLYKGVLDDFDLDGLPNADDPNPLKKQDSVSIEQTKLSTALNNVIRVKDKMDVELDEFVGKLRKVAPNDSKIYGRTKTPYSILNKLVNSRLLDERRGLKDLVGTTVAFNEFSDLEKFKKRVEKGMFGRVTEFDDYYAKPNDGYRAFHFIVEQNGTPIELQLKTDRMKQINVLSHDAYKNNALDKDYMLYLTTIANEADQGNKSAQNQYEMIMKDKVSVKKKLSSGQSK